MYKPIQKRLFTLYVTVTFKKNPTIFKGLHENDFLDIFRELPNSSNSFEFPRSGVS